MPLPAERSSVLASFGVGDMSPVRCCSNPEVQREDVLVRLPLILDSNDDEITGSKKLMRTLTGGDSPVRQTTPRDSVDALPEPLEACAVTQVTDDPSMEPPF